MPTETGRTATFVLTGPREKFTGFLGRYGFKDGRLTVPEKFKDNLKLILCNSYGCNIEGEKPIWETVKGGSIKVGEVEKPVLETTIVQSSPQASTVVPPPEPKVESKE